jgi:hypothetical protein
MTFFLERRFSMGEIASQRQQRLKSRRCPLKRGEEKKGKKDTYAEGLYTQKQKDRETTCMYTHTGKMSQKNQEKKKGKDGHICTHIYLIYGGYISIDIYILIYCFHMWGLLYLYVFTFFVCFSCGGYISMMFVVHMWTV